MLTIISSSNAHKYPRELSSMHRMRTRVFKDRLKWGVRTINGMEFDQFDTPDAVYLVYTDTSGEVRGSTRLIPTSQPYLLGDVFPQLVKGEVPRSPQIWESTRFGADPEAPNNIAAAMLAGMLEFGIANNLTNYVSVTDIRIEPLLKRIGWIPKRLGETIDTGTDTAAGEIFSVTKQELDLVKERNKLPSFIISNLHEYCPISIKEVA